MRIVFLCSSLAPGRDGVGDYTRRLAGECVRQGHSSVILALNDSHIQEAAFESQEMEGTSISVLRLPGMIELDNRAIMACEWVEDLKADWLSLQYVCYGYHPKGLSWRWNHIFAQLGSRFRHRHLMFHELWIGENRHPPLRQRLIGMPQRWIVCAMHRRFRPKVVTTSMRLYQRRLAHRGITANLLPLFGNIPMAQRDDEHIARLLCAKGSRFAQMPRATFLNGVVFGPVQLEFHVDQLIRWLMELRTQVAKPLLLNMVGRINKASARLAEQVGTLAPDAIEVVMLGEQSEKTISQALQFADFGINTHFPENLGKSGTLAAMREHGLPVVVAVGELDPTVLENGPSPVLQFSTENCAKAIINCSRHVNSEGGVIGTAAKLIRLFGKADIGPK
jgi:hypothetical protein